MYGLPSQRAACQKRAKERGWVIIKELTDDVTGTDTLRPGLTEVRRMAAAGETDIVLCYSVDRLSRDLVDVLNLTRELQQHVVVEYVTESFENSASGRLFLSLRGAIGAFEREQILARTQAGRIAKAKSGKVPGGSAPYGYRIDDGRFVIHDAEAAVVRQVYDWAAAGVSQRDIARRLNDAGVKPYMAAKWGKTSVGRIIGHEVYIGTAVYNARKRKKTILRPRPVAEHIEIPVPPIVSQELYDFVVIARATNREMLVGRPSRDYMLTGLLRCSCGKRMCGDDGLYRCTRRTSIEARKIECRTQVSARWLDDAVWTAHAAIMTDPVKLREAFASQYDEICAMWEQGSGARQGMEEKIEKLSKKEKWILDMMVDAESLEDRKAFKAKRDETRAQRILIESKLKAMKPVAQMPDVDELVRRARLATVGTTSTRDRRQLLRDGTVEIHWDGQWARMRIRGLGPELVPDPPQKSPEGPSDGGSALPIQHKDNGHSAAKTVEAKNRSACSHDRPSRLRQDDARQAPRWHPAPSHLRRGH